MATSVNSAFNEFMRDYVNLAPQRVTLARNSRDAMFDRINNLKNFLPLAKEYHMQFGSFTRGTKIRPIDDIDLIIGLNGGAFQVEFNGSCDNYKLKLTNTDSPFKEYCDCVSNGYYGYYNPTYYLNSTKIKNAFKSALEKLHDCSKAELHSRGEAITLKFTSYEWNFDIVPAFYATDYYLIPNGSGGWKKTNPKIDRDRVKRINTKCNGYALNLIRLAKYWNRRPTMASMPSYMLEAMVLNYCETKTDFSQYVDLEFKGLLYYIYQNIYGTVNDPKGIQGNINTLTNAQKQSIYLRSYSDYNKAYSAIYAETQEKDQVKAIRLWREILGGNFPTYG